MWADWDAGQYDLLEPLPAEQPVIQATQETRAMVAAMTAKWPAEQPAPTLPNSLTGETMPYVPLLADKPDIQRIAAEVRAAYREAEAETAEMARELNARDERRAASVAGDPICKRCMDRSIRDGKPIS